MEPSTETSNVLDREFVEGWGEKFAAAWNGRDPAAITALCTEDVVWADPAMNAPAAGRDAVAAFAAFTFQTFADFTVSERDAIYLSPIEPQALCPYTMRAERPTTFSLDAIDQWTFRGELLCRVVTFYDHAAMMAQLMDRR